MCLYKSFNYVDLAARPAMAGKAYNRGGEIATAEAKLATGKHQALIFGAVVFRGCMCAHTKDSTTVC